MVASKFRPSDKIKMGSKVALLNFNFDRDKIMNNKFTHFLLIHSITYNYPSCMLGTSWSPSTCDEPSIKHNLLYGGHCGQCPLAS